MLSVILKPLLFTFPRSRRRMTSAACGRMFQLQTDPLTGKSEWLVIQDEDDQLQTTPKSLLATTSYLDMLNDSRRNAAYRLAIDNTVTTPSHVLDIGYYFYSQQLRNFTLLALIPLILYL